MLRLPADCSQERFVTAWRRFLKAHHPDHNPDQSPEERRRFAEAVALWRR
jgi:DnaJ-class molecular chaperone